MRSPLLHSLPACVVALFLVCGCATPGRPLAEVTPEINATLDTAPLRLVPGDTLEARFPDKEEWRQTVRVRPDGRASFLSIGELQLGGLTLPEAEARVREAYSSMFPQLEVSLGTSALAPRSIYVYGEVHEPGAFPIEGRVSLIEALGLAGGHRKATALLEDTMLVRWVAQEGRQRVWNIDAGIESWKGSEPILLQPYDVVFIPNTPIDEINIWVDQYLRLMIPFPYLIPSPY
ncbi:MAG: polysaccharide biosynthesis/export family protein [Planctomycetes bacterium]|nr:polysaccharide biosynthesis/export family protein [Planctomycetota bacterium]